MESLNLEKFSPTKAELARMADESNTLIINGIDDREGYQRVHEARVKLKSTRVNLEKIGKMLRMDALIFQKKVIETEKELIAIIEPAEQLLQSKQEAIDEEKERVKRKALLPARQEQLKEIDLIIADDLLLLMDDTKFIEFFNTKKSLFLAEKERKIQEEADRKQAELKAEIDRKEALLKAESDRIELEKKRLQEQKDADEREKRHQAEVEKARKEAEAKTKRDIEAKIRAEAEEKERIEKERIQNEKAEAKRLAREKKYQEFLKKHGYTEKTKGDFMIQRKNKNEIVLFKKVDEYLDVQE